MWIFSACSLSIDEAFILYARHELNGCISTQITQYNDSLSVYALNENTFYFISFYINRGSLFFAFEF